MTQHVVPFIFTDCNISVNYTCMKNHPLQQTKGHYMISNGMLKCGCDMIKADQYSFRSRHCFQNITQLISI